MKSSSVDEIHKYLANNREPSGFVLHRRYDEFFQKFLLQTSKFIAIIAMQHLVEGLSRGDGALYLSEQTSA